MLYDFGSVDAYVLGGRDRYNHTATTRADVDFAIAGVSANSGPHRLVFNLLRRDVQASPMGVRNRQQVGYQHALSKRTELQAVHDRDGVDSSKPGMAVRAPRRRHPPRFLKAGAGPFVYRTVSPATSCPVPDDACFFLPV